MPTTESPTTFGAVHPDSANDVPAAPVRQRGRDAAGPNRAKRPRTSDQERIERYERNYWATRYEGYNELVAALDAPLPANLIDFFPTNFKERGR